MGTRPWRTFAMISIGVFASLLDLFIVNITFPDLRRDFAGTDLAQLSWVLNGYAIVFAALLVPAGRVVDLYGRKRGYVLGLALFTVAAVMLVAAVARSARHPVPVLELPLLRIPSFALAVASAFAFFAAFA